MDNEKIILLTVIAGSVFTFALIMTIISFVIIYQRKIVERENLYQLSIKNKEVELLQSVIQTQESERQKIAMNLHDQINPHLSALKFAITKKERDLLKLGYQTKGMDLESTLIDDIVQNINTITRDLSPQILYNYGIVEAFSSFMNNLTVVKTSISATNSDNIIISDKIALNVYRIGLEIIQNIIKHEKSTKIDVILQIQKENLILIIAHDGTGISNKSFVDLSDTSTGIGLNSLKTRTVLLNGILDYQNEPEAKITLTIPLNNESEN
jgi:two-component system NarL family sensor kinase